MVRRHHLASRRDASAADTEGREKAMNETLVVTKADRRVNAGAALRIVDVVKRYEGAKGAAVDRVSLDIAAGEFVSLLGASGSGKTTTLMMVAGFSAPNAGDILLDGRPLVHLPPEKRGIGVVFQNYALFPHMTALKNVAFPLKMRGLPANETARRAQAALERVGLKGFGHRLPSELSGGQQQRVALARAIVFEPGLLLMDEPLGALDRALREQMKGEIRRLHRELGLTILYVTHDQEEALTLSDRIALMEQGRIVQLGTAIDLYERPASPFVASFIGESTLIEGVAANGPDGRLGLKPRPQSAPLLPGTGLVAAGAPSVLVLRPEKIRIDAAASSGGLPATVSDVVYVGDVTRLVLTLEGGVTLSAKLPNRSDIYRPLLGASVGVAWSPAEALILPLSASQPSNVAKQGAFP
ncbi:MAG: ABC transporter ATP-binding protein, partial [Hyphomicrobiaceae bacterium]